MIRIAFLSALLCAAVGFVSQAASAQDADTREVERYVLSEPALAKFKRATQALASLGATCLEDDSDQDSESIGAMVAKIDGIPGARAAIQSAGMTTREYVVFTLSIVQSGMAAWALSQPGGRLPGGVSNANVDFYNEHEAELAALDDADRCEAGDSDASAGGAR